MRARGCAVRWASRPAAGRGCRLSSDNLEEAHPAEIGELGLVGVEHEHAAVREAHLEDAALALDHANRVGEVGGLKSRPGREELEEVAVQMEGVDRVELEDVGQ